jgi:hypothetical protein
MSYVDSAMEEYLGLKKFIAEGEDMSMNGVCKKKSRDFSQIHVYKLFL